MKLKALLGIGVVLWIAAACVPKPTGLIVDGYDAEQALTAAVNDGTRVAIERIQATENVRQTQAALQTQAADKEAVSHAQATSSAATPTAFALALALTAESAHASATQRADATQVSQSATQTALDQSAMFDRATQSAQADSYRAEVNQAVTNVYGAVRVVSGVAAALLLVFLSGVFLYAFLRRALAFGHAVNADVQRESVIIVDIPGGQLLIAYNPASRKYEPLALPPPATEREPPAVPAPPSPFRRRKEAAGEGGILVKRGGLAVGVIQPMTEDEAVAQTRRQLEALELLRAALDYRKAHPDFPVNRLPGAEQLGWSGSRWQRLKNLLGAYLEARDGNGEGAGTWVTAEQGDVEALHQAVRQWRVRV